MCGSTGAQNQLQQEQMDFYQNAINESQTAFGEQQGLQKQLESIYSPILQAGPEQEGFSQEEKNNLNAQAVEGTAESYQQAARAVNDAISARNGNNPLPTGADEQLRQEAALSATGQEDTEENQIIQADYATGRQNFQQATGALEGVSSELSPTSYEGAATSAGGAASTTANEIAQENNSWINAAIGAAAGVGSSVVDMNPGGVFGK